MLIKARNKLQKNIICNEMPQIKLEMSEIPKSLSIDNSIEYPCGPYKLYNTALEPQQALTYSMQYGKFVLLAKLDYWCHYVFTNYDANDATTISTTTFSIITPSILVLFATQSTMTLSITSRSVECGDAECGYAERRYFN